MNKSVLLALVVVLALGGGAALFLLDGGAHESEAAVAADQQAARPNPAASSEAPRALRPEGLSVESAPDAAASTVARSEAADSSAPLAMEVRVVIPKDTPRDEDARVVVEFASAGEDEPKRSVSAAIEPSGLARLELPAGESRGSLKLDARYLYLEDDVELVAPFEPLTIEPQLGGCLSVSLTLPSPLPSDVDLDATSEFQAVLRGWSMKGGNHATDKALDDHRSVVLGGLRP